MKKFLMTSKNIPRDSAVWNMAGTMLSAFQSVILLIVLSHTVGEEMAGIFTMGNVSANLFLFIGKYGVRSYQVSDVDNKYSFKDYHIARILSVAMMILVSVGYTLYSAKTVGYTTVKTQIIIWMCMMRVPEAYEDVFYGDYQKKERLDIGAKCLTLRQIATIMLFVVLVIISRNLLLSTIVSTIFTFLAMAVLIFITREMLDEGAGKGSFDKKLMFQMILAVTPIFLATFLSNYIGAAPKNAIDRYMDDSSQAIYGYISMPVFVVGLLANAVFNPILHKISCMYFEGRIKDFVKSILRQMVVIGIITVVCMAGAYILGIPVLSIMYNADLAPYKTDLMIIVLASGLLAFATFFMTVLTIMRKQAIIIIGYLSVAAAALFFSGIAVTNSGIRGAVVFYLILLTLLSVFFGISLIVFIVKAGNEFKAKKV